jgi:hypothetical protein
LIVSGGGGGASGSGNGPNVTCGNIGARATRTLSSSRRAIRARARCRSSLRLGSCTPGAIRLTADNLGPESRLPARQRRGRPRREPGRV